MSEQVVFLSYSHDSDEHREKVLALAERLREDGLDARLDQYINGTPEQGWPRWMLDQLDEAGFVLVVCTETYYRRFRGHEKPGVGKGVDWEGALITQEIYDAKSRTVKFVPVMLTPGQQLFIPEPLRPHTHYELTSEERYQALYAFLLGQASVEPRRLGAIRPVSKWVASPLTFGPLQPTLPAMIGVPHRNLSFTGRETLLSQLHQQLQTKGNSTLAQAALHGLGGIGKTQTAIEYVYRFGTHYRFVLWVVAEEEAAISAAYRSIARELGLVEPQADFKTAVLELKAWLSREDGWLLIFDNADDPALLRPYLPPARVGGKVLLTSRAKIFTDVGINEPFRVETLDPQDAVAFLINRTKCEEIGPAVELSEELGFLPLALDQAAAYINTVGVSLTDFLSSFRRRGLQLLEKGKPSADYPASIATTWNLSFSRIKKTSPASAALLTAAAFLNPDLVQIAVFTQGGSKLDGLLARALRGAEKDPLIFWELLEPLERYSLVERVSANGFKLHRLTQAVVKDSLGNKGSLIWVRWVVRAIEAAPPWFDFNRNLLGSRSNLAADLLALGDLAGAKRLQQKNLKFTESALGSEHPDTLVAGIQMANVLYELDDFAGARALYEQYMETSWRVLGREHQHTTVATWNFLSLILELKDSTAEAELLNKLRWLLDRDEASIPSTVQRKIRQYLLDDFRSI